MATAYRPYPTYPLSIPVASSVCRPWLCTLLIIAADICASGLVIVSSVLLRLAFGGNYKLSLYWRLWPLLGLFVAVFAISGLYPGIIFNSITEIRKIATSITVVFLIIAVLTFLLRVADMYSRLIFFGAWIASLFIEPLARGCVRKWFGCKEWWGYPTLVFGTGETARTLIRRLQQEPHLGFRIKIVLDDDPLEVAPLCGVPVWRGLDNAPRITAESNISHLIVAKPESPRAELLKLIESHAWSFPHVFIVPDLYGISSLSIEAQDVCRLLTLEVRRNLLLPSARIAKRVLDFGLAIVAGAALLPFIVLIIILLKLESRGPAFYCHSRIGRAGRAFRIWKFRTMIREADRVLQDYFCAHPELRLEWNQDRKLKNDPRITAVGRFLRKTSLDELPQIWNVLKGEMSLVGPRPIVREEISKYGGDFLLYEQVRPGMTGLWQISGRNDLSYAERVALDSYYVRNWSPWFDIYVLGRTIKVVLAGAGAY